MLVYAGIDEAGYGPMLGPLCVACCAFVLDGADPAAGPPDLWSILSDALCRSKRDGRKRIAIDDSKKLKGANTSKTTHPLAHLERGVLAFAGMDEDLPADDAALFDRLGVEAADRPWYASRTDLPVAWSADELHIASARLKRTMTGKRITCPLLRCRAIDPQDFNEGVSRMGRKSAVNFDAAMRHVDAVWRAFPHVHPRVIVDRQGGRTGYLRPLQMTWPDAQIRIIAESAEMSRYRLERAGSRLTISFQRESEGRHLPAALASMTAKYVRELHMARLNRFFTGHMPELKPTAGYVQDARRYLRDIAPLIDELRLPRRSLVRSV
jgi:ribonuclease HII